MVEDTPILSAAKRYIIYGDIGRGSPQRERKVRHSALASENLTNNQL